MISVRRRYVTILLAMLLISACITPAYARIGDIAGNYYYTDIKTYLYYSPITSYNIGGKTIIDAEILNWHYGFDVYWHADTRTLEINDKGGMFNSLQAMSGGLCSSTGGVTGKTAGHYYKTDIVAKLNGREIESYNIGGKTCISAEAMREFGYDVVWNAGSRTLTITKPIDFYSIETDYGTIKTRNDYEHSEDNLIKYNRGILLTDNNGTEKELAIPSGYVLYDPSCVSYVRLSDICSALGAECTLEQTMTEAYSIWANCVSYDESHYDYRINFTCDLNKELTFEPVQSGFTQEILAWPTDGKCYKTGDVSICINGETGQFVSMMGGSEYHEGMLIIEDNIYVPTYMVAKILGYAFAC